MWHNGLVAGDNSNKKIEKKRLLPAILVAVGIFWLGWAIGSGRIQVNSLSGKQVSKNLPENLDYSSVEQAYDALRKQYDGQLDVNKLLDGLKQGLAQASGDPYTEYLNEGQAKEFANDLSGCLDGIGAQLGKEGDNIVIIAPIPGYPAEKAGLRAKDVILEINDESASSLSITEAVSRIRGDVGTKVKLDILRGAERLEFEITREHVCIPSVESKIEGNVGYMKITTFNQNTIDLARKAAVNFKQNNVKGVILDLRDNPGGLLETAVDVSSLWLNDKVVLLEKRGGEVVKTYRSSKNPILGGIPTVVLINEGSASASEIVAGALKDNRSATVIGVKSFGKGSVQQIAELPRGGELKVTIARWFTPNDKNIDKEGIEPDKKVERTDEDYKNNLDPQLESAKQFLAQ